MKRVIYSYISNNETKHLPEYLNDKYDWAPVGFHGHISLLPWMEKFATKPVLFNEKELRQGIFNYPESVREVPLGSDVLEDLSSYQLNYLSWIQDTTGWNFSYTERVDYFYRMLKYWNSVILSLKPELFVSYTWPHLQSDFALYLICKYHYKIPCLFLDIVPHFDNGRHLIGSSLEELSTPIIKNYKDYKYSELDSEVIDYVSKLRISNQYLPRHVKEYFSFLDRKKSDDLKEFIKLFLGIFNGSSFSSDHFFKKNFSPWGEKKSLLNKFDYFFFTQKLRKQNKKNLRIYESITSPIEFKENYVYFAAPYQPEAISNLVQGYFENLFLILDIISYSIPHDFLIYYKEHPNTFKDKDKGALYRDSLFYKRLKSYKKIRIVDHRIESFKLIDHCRFSATVGGSVGWESILRGKPCLVFGTTWYDKCEGVFRIRNVTEAEKALSKILGGYKIDENKINSYAQTIFNITKKDTLVVTDYEHKIETCKSPLTEIEQIGDMFVKYEKKL